MLSLQQIHLTDGAPETVYQEAHEASPVEVELLDVAIRTAVRTIKLRQGAAYSRAAPHQPVGVPISIQACPLVMAPTWMMRLAWVPSSPSLKEPGRSQR